MSDEERDKLISYRNDLIALIDYLERVSSIQENLVCYGTLTDKEAEKNVGDFKKMIELNSNLIRNVEKQLAAAGYVLPRACY